MKNIFLLAAVVTMAPLGAYAQNFTLTAEPTPTNQPWTKPAYASFTLNSEGEDSYAVHAAGAYTHGLGEGLFLKGALSWQRDNQQTRPQDFAEASLGLHHENNPFRPGTGQDISRLWSFYTDGLVSYSRRTLYPTTLPPQCALTPTLPQCGEQHLETIRLSLSSSPFRGSWARLDASGFAMAFAPTGALIFDEAIDTAIDPNTGLNVEGSLTAAKFNFDVAIAPRLFDYRWQLSLSGQAIQRLDADERRQSSFARSSTLFTAALDYALGSAPLDAASDRGVFPSIGLVYTNGEDPLAGRAEQETLTLALRLRCCQSASAR